MKDTVQTQQNIKSRINKLTSRLVSEQKDKAFSEQKPKNNFSLDGLDELSNLKRDKMLSAETILQMNPDTRRAMALVAGLITCPNGGSEVKLNFLFDDNVTEVTDDEKKVLEVIREYFTSEYNIEATQFDKVERIISKQGAEIYAILPDSAVDDIINNHENATPVALETLRKNKILSSANTHRV